MKKTSTQNHSKKVDDTVLIPASDLDEETSLPVVFQPKEKPDRTKELENWGYR